MVLKLYGMALVASCTRVIVCLHEKGLDFQLLPVDLLAFQNKQPDFLTKNPFGLAPVLEDGELTLFESRAITGYICEKFKNLGYDLTKHESLNENALVKVWTEVASKHYDPAIAAIVYQHFVAPLYSQKTDQIVIDANLEKLEKVLDIYEAKLSKTKYLAGDFYSIADLHHFPYTFYFMKSPWASLINDRPHVKAWWEDISSRPASQKVAEGMNLVEIFEG
ncbi:hypothetical protein UlMin_031258 [Ulmus minor]